MRFKSLVFFLFLSWNTVAQMAQDDGPTVAESHDPSRWGPNVVTHSETNSIDPLTHTSTISGGGYSGMAQLIGDSSVDTSYRPGQASIATIGGGYNNVNNQLAGTISGGAHHVLFSSGDHGTVSGGSSNFLSDGSYSTIAGGKKNSIFGGGSSINGGVRNVVSSSYSSVGSGFRNTVSGYSSSIAAGRNNNVEAAYSFASGRAITIQQSALGSAVFGLEAQSTSPGSVNVSGRGVDGQAILLNLNNRTSDASPKHLVGSGSWTTPIIPANSIWAGSLIVSVTDGELVTAFNVEFATTAQRVASVTADTIVNELNLNSPTISLKKRRILVNVVGRPGILLTWNAAGVVSQANF